MRTPSRCRPPRWGKHRIARSAVASSANRRRRPSGRLERRLRNRKVHKKESCHLAQSSVNRNKLISYSKLLSIYLLICVFGISKNKCLITGESDESSSTSLRPRSRPPEFQPDRSRQGAVYLAAGRVQGHH